MNSLIKNFVESGEAKSFVATGMENVEGKRYSV